MTGSAEMESFCDSFSDDVIANLSRFHEISVIARHSSFAFKGSHLGVAEIGEKLGVRYLLEGSLIGNANSISINIHLIDVLTSFHVWGQPFEGEIEGILGFEREVTRRVVNLLPSYIEAAERMRVRRLDAADLQSLDYVLRGLELYEEHTREGHARAAEMFEKAIDCDPSYARAYTALSRVHNHRHRYCWADDPDASLRTSLSLARTAVRLDPGDPKGLSELGQVLLWMKDVEAALSCYRRALALNPNDADVMVRLAEALSYAGQPSDALNLINEAINLNPFPSDEYFWFKADALFNLERYQEVIETARLMQDPTEADRLVAASYALTGAFEKAREHAAFVLRKHPEFRIGAWIARQPDSKSEECQRFAAGLRLAGLPD
jgi:TolB-like protein